MSQKILSIEDLQSVDCLRQAVSRLQLWQDVISLIGVRKMLEVGVWKGEFAKTMLRECPALEQYYMIDPWATLPDWQKPFNVNYETFEAVYSEAMNETAFAAQKRVVLRGRTKEVIDAIPDGSLDFAYIDGDHTLRGITIDLIKVLPKIRDGGFVGGDDFATDPRQHDLKFEPTFVCPFAVYFAESMDLPILALKFGQFLIQRRTGSRFSFTDLTGAYADLSLNKYLAPRREPLRSRLRNRLSTLFPPAGSGNHS